MGFKAMPWKIYYKPSLDEFVIRQRHTNLTSERVKAIQQRVAALKPGAAAHQAGLPFARKQIRYINGQRQVVDVVPIKVFSKQLRDIMKRELGGGAGALPALPPY